MVNKPAFEALPADLQAIVTYAARAVNQDMLDSYTANNSRALKELIAQGVQIKRLPDEVLKRFYEIAQDVYAKQAAQDPQFKKVLDSYMAFMKDAAPYQKISEQTYYEVREQQMQDH
jgi:TRAP-type mannitol/chloroaromatic compound transport system substrate-binding protein